MPYIDDSEKYSNCACSSNCEYVFNNINMDNNCSLYLTTNDLPFLISYLTKNNYKIDSKITKVLNKEDKNLLFYITN